MRRFLCALALVVLAVALVRGEDETYKLKPPAPLAEGKAIKLVEKTNGVNHIKVTDEDGKVIRDDKQPFGSEMVFTKKVLKRDKTGPTKFQHTYEKASETEGKKPVTQPYQGRTIVFERVDGKLKATAEGKPEIDEKVLQKLAEAEDRNRAGKHEVLLPGKAVKVGEKWAFSGAKVAEVLGSAKDTEKAEGTGKLVKVYKKDGKLFCVVDLVCKVEYKPKNALNLVSSEFAATLHMAVDGSSSAGTMTAKGKALRKFEVEQDGKKYQVEIRTEGTESTVATEAK
jgi:hypothetical protein